MGQSDKDEKTQLNLQNQLQQQQLAKQNATQDKVQASLAPYLTTEGQGFTPAQLAALHGSALDQNALRYNDAAKQTNAALAARGENGLSPLSGTAATGYSTLNASKAGDLADALRTITLNDAQQNQANRFNAASVYSGNAQTYAGNVGTFGSGASNALSNLQQAQSNGFGANFGRTFAGGLGSGLGSGLAAGFTGGLGTAASKVGSGNYGW